MRFMMMIKATAESEAGLPPDPALMAAVARRAEEAIRSGVLVDTGGLVPSSGGARVKLSGGRTTVVDGPFAEAKELVGGYAIIEAASRDEAVRVGREFMQLHADVLGPAYEGEMEIRQIVGPPTPGT
jgi:hypothetical protein